MESHNTAETNQRDLPSLDTRFASPTPQAGSFHASNDIPNPAKDAPDVPTRVKISDIPDPVRSIEMNIAQDAAYLKFSEQSIRRQPARFPSVDTEMSIALLRG